MGGVDQAIKKYSELYDKTIQEVYKTAHFLMEYIDEKER
ncbi:hypothetical protein SZ39_5045 [Bacillus mycoides]|nr:hypothetical protein SZ39_5045 [Bacillus mycoides]